MRLPISIVTIVFVSLCLARIPIKRFGRSDLNAFNDKLLRNSERKLASLAPLEYLSLLKRLGKLALYIRLYRRLHENPYSGASRFTATFPKPPVQFDKDLYETCRKDFVNCTYFIFDNVQERARFIFPAKEQYLKDFPIVQEDFRRMVSNRMFEFDMTVSYIMCYFTKNRVTALRYLPFCRYNANTSAPFNIWHSPRFKAAKDREDFDFWPRDPYFETIDDLVNGFDEWQCADQSFCPNPCCVNGQDELTTQCRHPACTDPLANVTNATNYPCQAPVEWNRDLPGIVDNDWNITCDCGEKQEYRLDVRRCVDLDECLEDPCKNDSNTECVKTVGGFECVCRLGYLRNRGGTCSEVSLHKTEWHGEAVKSAASAHCALPLVYLFVASVYTLHALDFFLV